MAYQPLRSGRNRPVYDAQSRLRYAFDAGHYSLDGFPRGLDLVHDDDDDGDEDSSSPLSSDSETDDGSDGKSARWADVAASFRVFSDSLLRMERAESEMAKAREALRLEAEKRRAESEAELTQMMLRTQFQIASLVSRRIPSQKRKRVEEGERTSAVASQRSNPWYKTMQIQKRLVFTLMKQNSQFQNYRHA
ncbi:hypothetical protein FNV43_RR07865 [Rhamnella rubrinervis]|uniref:Uncharacterized protein n=1 Tax=Rhamnella rubrinervis TaxID=2594499 RepID=A0A8K0HHE6_9ROSA|nr:hypothetical protein FNV43_RR07865 [Rhamnella rubrinervis]